jgi:Helix-turn-helix domain
MQVKSENEMHVNQNSMPEPRVATLDEVARILRISRGGAYAAARRGDFPTVRIGKRILVPLVAIERLLGNA